MTLPLTIAEAGAALRRGSLTSTELTTRLLDRADRIDPELGIYMSRFDASALEAAAVADAELVAGENRGPLHGVPIAVKDIISTVDGPTTGQSLVFDSTWGDQTDAPAVERLRKAGAIILGKATTMEFATGLPDPGKPFPLPRNPWNPAMWAGGSSSGTGSGVAAGLFLGALGTDTSGSGRIPAAVCGVTGFKPTFGLVPKSGCMPLGASVDHVTPMARTARDCAMMLTVMAGYEPSDPCTLDVPARDYCPMLDGSVAGLRIGVDRKLLHDRPEADPALADVFDSALATLADAGAELVDVTIPYFDELTDATMLSFPAEAFGYHRRHLQTRWQDYGAGARFALVRGALIGAADYVQLQRVRRVGRQATLALFDTVDALVTPTVTIGAPPVERLDASEMASAVLTAVWNAVGFPALSVPMGFTASRLPLGLQIITPPLADCLALRIGDAFQGLTDWHVQVPPGLD